MQLWSLGYMTTSRRSEAVMQAASVELLSIAEMEHLFPDWLTWREWMGGLVESIVAIKD